VNRRQKALLTQSILVLTATLAAVIGMINVKDYINRSEALRAMGQLGRRLSDYRQQHGFLPPESFIDGVRDDLDGGVRMGKVKYQALHIGPDASPETILAYSEKRYPSSFLEDGYVVLHLDGTVEWIPTVQFEDLLGRQQTSAELHEPGNRTY